jgi:hypothetical protein
MPAAGVAVTGNTSLGEQCTSGLTTFFTAYTGTGVPASPVPQYLVTDGYNGAIYFEIVENNVAGGATVTPQGSFDSINWYSLGFYLIVSAGTTQTTLARAIGAQGINQNTRYVFQILDAYPFMRVSVTANGSTASLTAKMYCVPS